MEQINGMTRLKVLKWIGYSIMTLIGCIVASLFFTIVYNSMDGAIFLEIDRTIFTTAVLISIFILFCVSILVIIKRMKYIGLRWYSVLFYIVTSILSSGVFFVLFGHLLLSFIGPISEKLNVYGFFFSVVLVMAISVISPFLLALVLLFFATFFTVSQSAKAEGKGFWLC
jgi:hypothetical protein